MILPSELKIPPNGSNNSEGGAKINGRKSSVPYQDITSEMEPKERETTTTPDNDFRALLNEARVRPTDSIEEFPACLIIQKDGKSYTLGSMGNLSTVTGRAKAKKTFVVGIAIAAVVSSRLILDRVMGKLPMVKQTVLLFDTEQSKFDVLKGVKRICRLCQIDDPPNLQVFSLRAYSPQKRLQLIDFVINNTPGIGLVVIDGVRDLAVDPILDSAQASNIMTHLLQWTDKHTIHIMCVLHQNKSDSNLRGHLGTELVNKSETVISVSRDSKDKDISHVEAEYCRNPEFEPFSFYVDDTALPRLIEGENCTDQSDRKGKRNSKLSTVDNMSPETVSNIINEVFSQYESLLYNQLLTTLLETSKVVKYPLSKGSAEVFIKRVLERNLIEKFKPQKSRYNAYRKPIDSVTT